jgi:hypothetical protein
MMLKKGCEKVTEMSELRTSYVSEPFYFRGLGIIKVVYKSGDCWLVSYARRRRILTV